MWLFNLFSRKPGPGLVQKYRRLIEEAGIQSTPQQVAALQVLEDKMQRNKHFNAYIYGGVGSGKSFCMQLFYESAERPKRRFHYTDFMNTIHASFATLGSATAVAREIGKDARILCIDEFAVVDIADAMVLSSILRELAAQRVTVCVTSNRYPSELYLNGVQRESFYPAIDFIISNYTTIPLFCQDWRQTGTLASTWMTPVNENTGAAFEAALLRCQEQFPNQSLVADFSDLCEANLCSIEYLELASQYRYFFIRHLPRFSLANRDVLRRFISLVDILYDSVSGLFILSSTDLQSCFGELREQSLGGSNTNSIAGHEELFASERCYSRLLEMQSAGWLEKVAKK